MKCDGKTVHYHPTMPAIFLCRSNRFVARCVVDGREVDAHIANTGRLGELLLPGVPGVVTVHDDPKRRTRYTLVAVYCGKRLVNIDSQAPHKLVAMALEDQALRLPGLGEVASVRREVRVGESRLDLCAQGEKGRMYIEVKGVTLEREGVALFPDAPTQRGARHLRELTHVVQAGELAAALFVVQLAGAKALRLNDIQDPQFGQALRTAAAAGVVVLAVECRVTPEDLELGRFLPVEL